MSDTSNQPNYEEYWPHPTFSVLGVDQGYIIEKSIVPAENLLVRFSSLEPFELALGINSKIIAHKMNRVCSFPKPFLLCKTRHDKHNDRVLYFLLEAEDLFPFRYTWADDTITFDFTGIVFKENEIRNIEFSAAEYDFQLSHHDKAPKPYGRLAFLQQNFPLGGPEALIAPLMEKMTTAPPAPIESGNSPKDMSKPNKTRRENVESRWKDQFSIGMAAAVFCMKQYQETGKPVPRKAYEAAIRAKGYRPLMVEADTLFRQIMPPEVLHRGD